MKRTLLLIVIISIVLITSCQQFQNEILTLDSIQEYDTFQYTDQISPEVMKKEIKYLSDQIIDIHPSENKHDIINDAFKELSEEIKDPLLIGDYVLNLMIFLAELGDSHTLINPINIKSDQLAIELEWLKDGLFVSNSKYKQIQKGDKVLKIGDMEYEEILQFMKSIIPAENEYLRKQRASAFLTHEFFLRAMSVLDGDSVTIVTKRDNEKLLHELILKSSSDINISNEDTSGWYDWKIYDKYNIGYFELRESKIDSDYEKEVKNFFEEVNRQRIKTILIDIRENSGGNSDVMIPFIEHLSVKEFNSYGVITKFSKTASSQRGYHKVNGLDEVTNGKVKNNHRTPLYSGDIYILTGPKTYSSGTVFAVQLHDVGLATIIGEPTGGSPSHYGDFIEIALPYSNIPVAISHKKFIRPQKSYDPANTLYPNIMIERTRDEIIKAKDIQLLKALKIAQE